MFEKDVTSRMEEGSLEGGSVFILPARCGLGVGMIFGVVLFLFSLFMVGGVITGSVYISTLLGCVLAVLGFTVLFMLGFALLFFGFKSRYSRYRVVVSGGGVKVSRVLFKKVFVSSFAEGEVMGVGLYSSSETNGKPDYGIVVEGRDRTRITFGYGHGEEDLRWLASRLLSCLLGQGGLPREDAMDLLFFDYGEQGDLEKVFERQGVKVVLDSDDCGGGVSVGCFSIEKSGTKVGRVQILIGLFGLMFGGLLSWVSVSYDDGSVFLGLVGGVLMLGGLVLLFMGLFKLGTLVRYVFGAESIRKELLRGGVSKSNQVYERSELRNLYVDSSGSSNGSARYSITLRGEDDELKIFRWADEEVMDVVRYKIREWLKPVDYGSVDDSAVGALDELGSVSEEVGAVLGQDEGVDHYVPGDVPVYDSVIDMSDMKGVLWFVRFFLMVFILVGLGWFINGVFDLVKAHESEFWPSVEGVVLSSEVSVDSGGDGVSYGVDVTYRYVVDDRGYEGDRVAVSDLNSGERERAVKIVERYPVGSLVRVFYEPADVEFSVLEPGVAGASWMLLGLGFLFFSFGLMFVIGNERQCREGRRKARRWERCVGGEVS